MTEEVKLSPRETEIVQLAFLFFWYRCEARNRALSELDSEGEINEALIGALMTQEELIQNFLTAIISNEAFTKIFVLLTTKDFREIVTSIDETFRHQESCNFCENWSYFDTAEDPIRFATSMAAEIIPMLEFNHHFGVSRVKPKNRVKTLVRLLFNPIAVDLVEAAVGDVIQRIKVASLLSTGDPELGEKE